MNVTQETVEHEFMLAPKELQNHFKNQLGDGDDSPNWDMPSTITFGWAQGANQRNRILWQGDRYWLLPNA